MDLLKDLQLFGEGLVVIDSPELVGRYNECLTQIGLEPTERDSFNIDGMGWSPEIAEERHELSYLSHGDANQFGIIITPSQYRKPVHYPFYSFMRSLMEVVFDGAMAQIIDVTTDSGVWLDIDQEISHYLQPTDLLMVDSIQVRAFTPRHLMAAAREQLNLAARFMRKPNGWRDVELRKKIIESRNAHGDLRHRNVVIPNIIFTALSGFHTRAFGGVYVFQNEILSSSDHLLIVQDTGLLKKMSGKKENVLSVGSKDLVRRLCDERLIEIDWQFYRDHMELIAEKRVWMLINAMAGEHPDLDFDELSVGEQRKFTNKFCGKLPETFFEFEHIYLQLEGGEEPNVEDLSSVVRRALYHPRLDLPYTTRTVVWQLLSEIERLDVLVLYIYNKLRFFERYETWPPIKRQWVAKHVRRHYVPYFRRKEAEERKAN